MSGVIQNVVIVWVMGVSLVSCGGGGDSAESSQPSVPLSSAPAITRQPASVTVIAPASATFTVTATGTAPLSYQWQRDGVAIVGATASSYTLAATGASDTGAILAVIVSNTVGSATSTNATLTVDTPQQSTLSSKSLVHDSLARDYLEYVPSGLTATTAVPLVIVLHGGKQDASVTAESLPSRAWRDIADVDPMIVVYPNGVGNKWNDCRSDWVGSSTVDDVGFIAAVIDDVSSRREIDSSRIYVTGASNGGMMTYRIGLALSSRIAGIGAIIANNPVDPLGICPMQPTAPLSVVIMNGTVDPLMPYDGGFVSMMSSSGSVISAIATRDYWLSANGCALTAVTETLLDSDLDDESTVTLQRYTDCLDDQKVVYFRVDGGGHTTPSRKYFTDGRQNRDVEGAEEIWRILRDARRN
jgi:polyhydroxybutyrate depolymerase